MLKTEAEEHKELNEYQAEHMRIIAPIDADSSIIAMNDIFQQDFYSHFIHHQENFAVPKLPGIDGMAGGVLVLGF